MPSFFAAVTGFMAVPEGCSCVMGATVAFGSISPMLTIAFATGTEPGKWIRRYQGELETIPSDDPFAESAQLHLMRLPDARVTDEHHVVRLYEEAPGVAVPKDSVFAGVGEAVDPSELAEEIVNAAFTEQLLIDELRSALQVVAANVGIAYGPLPLLKNLSRKQVVPLPLTEGPTTTVALVWRKADDSEEIQDFVGVAKGRTANSSRGSSRGSSRRSSSGGNRENRAGKKRNTKTAVHPRSRGRKRGR